MNGLDYGIVVLYIVVMVALGFYFKKSKGGKDYFLGNKQFGWFSLCLSVMATQLSVISFVSAPAFVGLRPGGGMQWLTFEFGVPLAMAILIATLAPSLFRSGVVSVYSYLEERFGRSSRNLLSCVFLLSRSFGTSIGIYAVTLILSSILVLPFWQTIIIVAGITVLYSYEGGMKAIVYSEVIQMIIKFLGILIIMAYAFHYVGGWESFTQNLDRNRLQVIRFSNSGFDGTEYGFWPMLLGGIFLYISYYGVDQTQAQRILSAKDETTVKKLLLFNGLFRFPITLSYCFAGLLLGTYYRMNADFASLIPKDKPDLMVPVFLTNYLPHGVIGIIVVSILAAAMSSFSSTLNSLSAVTMEDFISKRKNFNPSRYVIFSKLAALAWGIVIIILAFYVGDIAKTVIEAINKIGSLFYGPIVTMFIIGFYFRKIPAFSANAGVIIGVLGNMLLWIFFKHEVFWFWWNVVGAFVTFVVASVLTYGFGIKKADPQTAPAPAHMKFITWQTALLLGFFILIFVFCLILPGIF
jgi:SSS family transporter